MNVYYAFQFLLLWAIYDNLYEIVPREIIIITINIIIALNMLYDIICVKREEDVEDVTVDVIQQKLFVTL